MGNLPSFFYPLVEANFQKIFERLAVTRSEVGDVFLCDTLGKGLLGL
jgi:hypothetical protein